MFASAPFAIKVCHNIFGFSFVLTLFGFQLSPLVLQMSVVSRSKRVVLCGRPNIAGNGLQAGTVCILKQCLPKCLFKDTNVCCFCKNGKTCLPKILQKLLPRLRKLCLLAVSIKLPPHS